MTIIYLLEMLLVGLGLYGLTLLVDKLWQDAEPPKKAILEEKISASLNTEELAATVAKFQEEHPDLEAKEILVKEFLTEKNQ